jgi:hypothetical protein
MAGEAASMQAGKSSDLASGPGLRHRPGVKPKFPYKPMFSNENMNSAWRIPTACAIRFDKLI